METAKKKPWKTGASSGHLTNLEESILETFNIYDQNTEIIEMAVKDYDLYDQDISVSI
jgi:hypothetical protein